MGALPLEYSTDHLVEEARCVSGVKNSRFFFFSWVVSSLSSCLCFLLCCTEDADSVTKSL